MIEIWNFRMTDIWQDENMVRATQRGLVSKGTYKSRCFSGELIFFRPRQHADSCSRTEGARLGSFT